MASLRYLTIPFEPWHEQALVPVPAPAEALVRFAAHGGTTLWDGEEERAVACAGIITFWPGCGYAWFLACADADFHRHAIARFAKRELAVRLPAFRRVEALIPVAAMTVRVFVQWLGFREVLYKKAYGPLGEDFIECEWLREAEAQHG